MKQQLLVANTRNRSMLLLVNGATKDVEPLIGNPRLGVLITPGTKGGGPKNDINRIIKWGCWWGVDNGAFSGLDVPAFLKLLAAIVAVIAGRKHRCAWVAAPDCVGNAIETLRRFRIWGPLLRELGLPVAIVGQDGMTPEQVPWDEVDALFVGGTDAWKLTIPAAELSKEAKRLGKWVHVGRCNSKVRFKAAIAMGADSCDGSQFSWWPRRYIPKGLRWIEEAEAQITDMRSHLLLTGAVCETDVLDWALAGAKPRGGGKSEPRKSRLLNPHATTPGLFSELATTDET